MPACLRWLLGVVALSTAIAILITNSQCKLNLCVCGFLGRKICATKTQPALDPASRLRLCRSKHPGLFERTRLLGRPIFSTNEQPVCRPFEAPPSVTPSFGIAFTSGVHASHLHCPNNQGLAFLSVRPDVVPLGADDVG
jgi:hypothetical protein